MWMVYDNEDGLVGIFRNYDEAIGCYGDYVERVEDYVRSYGEFMGDERVILAKISKHSFVRDTGRPVLKVDDNGEEYETKDTYWELKQESY